jgi:hypothetical protein
MRFLLGIAVGYVLGARAGRQRYDDIAAVARRVAGSPTVQATAGALQAQAAGAAERAKSRLGGRALTGPRPSASVNGHRH